MATCPLSKLAITAEARGAYDPVGDPWEVDLEALPRSVPLGHPLVLGGHLAHRMKAGRAAAQGCHPEALRLRLESRSRPPAEVQENVGAVALGVVLAEVVKRTETFEVDTTDQTPEETSLAGTKILAGRGEAHRPSRVDWSEVILGWS